MSAEIFPVKHPSPLNFFAITNDVKGLEEFFSRESQSGNDGTDYSGLHNSPPFADFST